jgi:hypothetical protein
MNIGTVSTLSASPDKKLTTPDTILTKRQPQIIIEEEIRLNTGQLIEIDEDDDIPLKMTMSPKQAQQALSPSLRRKISHAKFMKEE